jgi:hypothetical protein
MAMKKAEMEDHSYAYHQLMRDARNAEASGMYREAMEAAVSAWPHIDGMMQFEQRYQDAEFSSIPAIDLALKYAPLLLDLKRLDEIEQLLMQYRRIQKNASADLGAKVGAARAQIWQNHRLWGHLEQNPDTLQEELHQILGGEQERWRTVAASWEKMGLLNRTPEGRSYRLSLSTRMGEVISGKCPRCGHVDQAPKAMFLEQISCPQCRSREVFVLLAPAGFEDDQLEG